MNSISTSWRKCIRKFLKLDAITRSRYMYIPLLLNKHDIRTQLMIRGSSFWIKCFYSENNKIRLSSKLSLESNSTVANNIRQCLSYINRDYQIFISDENLPEFTTVNKSVEIIAKILNNNRGQCPQ